MLFWKSQCRCRLQAGREAAAAAVSGCRTCEAHAGPLQAAAAAGRHTAAAAGSKQSRRPAQHSTGEAKPGHLCTMHNYPQNRTIPAGYCSPSMQLTTGCCGWVPGTCVRGRGRARRRASKTCRAPPARCPACSPAAGSSPVGVAGARVGERVRGQQAGGVPKPPKQHRRPAQHVHPAALQPTVSMIETRPSQRTPTP